MVSKEFVAMLLAGGQGSRLGALTKNTAKPAVPFGGKYRIIDFTLSNCTNSAIDTIGVLTQYRPLRLNSYIGMGQPWDLDRLNGGVTILSPYVKQKAGEWYKGTANAIYQNIEFLERYNPKYVLILSGDQIYKMDYSKMLKFHKEKNAGLTIACIEVPWKDANRFGIMETNEDSRIVEFAEKPSEPKSNMASMGVYIFNWPLLRECLIEDQVSPDSSNDFGKDIIPKLIRDKEKVYGYPYKGYWKDVGTVRSLWEANMDLLDDDSELDLNDPQWRIYSRNPVQPPHYVADGAIVKNSIVTEGCEIYGEVHHSVLFANVTVGTGSIIRNSVIMPNTCIGVNTVVENTIVSEDVVIGDGYHIGNENGYGKGEITVIGENISITSKVSVVEDAKEVTR